MATPDTRDQVLASLHPLEVRALNALNALAAAAGAAPTAADVSEAELGAGAGLEPEQVRTAVQWLLAKELIRVTATETFTEVTLTEAGRRHAELGTPETRILARIAAAAAAPGGATPTMAALAADPALAEEDVAAACGGLKKLGAIAIEKGGALVLAAGGGGVDATADFAALETVIRAIGASTTAIRLDTLSPAERALVEDNARKRGQGKGAFRLADRARSRYALTPRGGEIAAALAAADLRGDEISGLTPDLLRDGKWRSRRFRRYNLALKPSRVLIGHRHPYAEFLDRVREKFIALGFAEMRGDLVENEFWNMDALFMPQFHAARDIHDVYFVKQPSHARAIEEPYATRVAAAHETGGDTGSRGWRYRFDLERAKRLVLRSQGTALSARTLAANPEIPGKYFAIARCFRYDQVDATHASDFFQIEGIVLGRRIDFRHLLGLLQLFAVEVAAAREIRFAPAYFPFTEPSVELHANHPALGWMELGGAGIFRPELTAALGVDVPVLAWGLGLDRMAMTALGINDIRQLFTTDLEFMRTRRAEA